MVAGRSKRFFSRFWLYGDGPGAVTLLQAANRADEQRITQVGPTLRKLRKRFFWNMPMRDELRASCGVEGTFHTLFLSLYLQT